MLATSEWFGQYICPIIVGIHLDYAKETLANLISEMIIF
jgi:hypothetical protein